jgi:tetratricopeptide (TPR) repeat protein
LGCIGSCYENLGENKKALEYFEKGLSIKKEVYGERHPETAVTLGCIGYCYRYLGENKKALDYFDQQKRIENDFKNK